MSGGTFEYIQFRIEDAVSEIERRLAMNGVSVKDAWEAMDEEQRDRCDCWQRPWTTLDRPCWVDDQAIRETEEELGDIGGLDAEDRKKWNEARRRHVAEIVEGHNSSLVGDGYSEKTVDAIRKMVPAIRLAAIYLNRIDWLMAGDDGEESFLERVGEDVRHAGLETPVELESHTEQEKKDNG